MDPQKRNFLSLVIPAALVVRFGFCAGAGLAQSRTAPQNPSPPPPAVPLPTPGLPDGAKLDPKAILKKNQEQIHSDIEKIYALAGDLKDEVEKTDSADVLSLPMIQKAEQIEKLAKQVKNLARGN
jgi:uncharacterized alpha/beta hydrolase family protein